MIHAKNDMKKEKFICIHREISCLNYWQKVNWILKQALISEYQLKFHDCYKFSKAMTLSKEKTQLTERQQFLRLKPTCNSNLSLYTWLRSL